MEGSRIRREYPITIGRIEGHGKRGKALTADYVLEYRNTKLAVVEAKAWDEALTEGVAQAKNYAGKLAIRYTFSTNGQGIYGIDMETGEEDEKPSYPTPDALWGMTFAEENLWRDRFAAIPFEDRGGYFLPRYYQDIAIERVMQAIAEDRQRILLTLATGTGKTFIAFQIAWKLFQSRWNLSREPTRRPRILFLADRNILADQAFNAFSAFAEDALVRIEPADIRKKGKVPKNGNLFFTIFQTFMSGPPKDGEPSPYFGGYPPDFFDFIVSYLTSTPKGKLTALENDLLDREWKQARPKVRVKLLPKEGETYVLAESGNRILKERSMRRRRLRKSAKSG